MTWLTHPEVRKDVEDKVQELSRKIDHRHATTSMDYEHALVYSIVSKSLSDGLSLKREWFFSSVGIEWVDGDRETCYLSRAPISTTFSTDNVFHWTHWVGRAYTRLKEALQSGSFPEYLEYGPPGRERRHPAGPLIHYLFTEGRLEGFDFQALGQSFQEVGEPAAAPAPPAEPLAPHFGLKDIVELRDVTQDDQIRGRMGGIFTLLGGPGTGKTTVALHRIPYLLLEQKEQLPLEAPQVGGDFFSAGSIHVVVWEDHLVPYLKDCLLKLHFGDVSVQHIDDWVASRLRSYVSIGKGKDEYQIRNEPDDIMRIKLGYVNDERNRVGGLTEQTLERFLTGKNEAGDFYHDQASASLERFETIDGELRELVVGTQLPFRESTPGYVYTAAGIEQVVANIRNNLDSIQGEIKESRSRLSESQERAFKKVAGQVEKFRDRVSNLRDSELERVGKSYPSLLTRFYTSDLARQDIERTWGNGGWKRFLTHVEKRDSQRFLSRADRYLLLWLIHFMTRGTEVTKTKVEPLPLYSHTVIDEAQYYHPLVLRLLVSLAKPPLLSMTIVGDMEQKVSPEGLASWDEIGVPRSQFQLETNYRWSRQVYQFLELYRREADLKVKLRPPRTWTSGDGLTPEIVTCTDKDDEIDWLVRRVTDLRRKDQSMAIVVADSIDQSWRDRVIDELRGCDIRSRWAEGEDVRECVDQVVMTNYSSVVGLEFDAVFLPRIEHVLSAPSSSLDARQSAWVALTRAKKFIGVSHVETVGILDRSAFAEYRTSYPEE